MKRPRLTLSSSNSSVGRAGHPGGGSGSGGVRSAVGGSQPQGGGVSRHGMASGGGAAGVGLGGGMSASMLSVTDVDVKKGILVQVTCWGGGAYSFVGGMEGSCQDFSAFFSLSFLSFLNLNLLCL